MIVSADIQASNGVIHVIDTVLLVSYKWIRVGNPGQISIT